jgi:hypothetical protein
MISQKVKQFANNNGFDFFANGLGYRTMAQITNLDGTVNITRCGNNSKLALQAINALIAQRKLDAASNEAIAAEAEQAYEDLTPVTPAICEVEAEQAYQELLPVAPDRRRFYKRTSYMGIGVEVYCGDERYGYALAELLERPLAEHPMPTYTPRDTFGDNDFALSGR